MDFNNLFTGLKKQFSTEKILTDFIKSVLNCCDAEYLREIYIDLYIAEYGETMTEESAAEFLNLLHTDCEASPRWSMSQCFIAGKTVGVDFTSISKIDWYTSLNFEYEKHKKTAEKLGYKEDIVFYAMISKDEWQEKNIFEKFIETIK